MLIQAAYSYGKIIKLVKEILPAQAWELLDSDNAAIVDVRAPIDFGAGHPNAAFSIPYSAKGLSERLQIFVDLSQPIICLTSNDEETAGCEAQLTNSFSYLGVIQDGISGWIDSGLPLTKVEDLSIDRLSDSMLDTNLILLDVREQIEWEIGYVPGATLISLSEISTRNTELDKDKPVAVICEAGIRSSTAVSILQRAGFEQVSNVIEGTAGYRLKDLPLNYK